MRRIPIELTAAQRREVQSFRGRGLHLARSGAPRTYATDEEAAVAALACSPASAGCKRWTVGLLTAAVRKQDPKLKTVSRETVRRWLKKTS